MKAYLITYKVKGEGAIPGNAVVIAESPQKAIEIFISEWNKEFTEGKADFSPEDIEKLSIGPICDASEVYTEK